MTKLYHSVKALFSKTSAYSNGAMEEPLLEPTIQTYLGMVQHVSPAQRDFYFVNDDNASKSYDGLRYESLQTWIKGEPLSKAHTFTSQAFADYVLGDGLPNFKDLDKYRGSMRLRRNILACRSSGVNDIEFMKRNITSLRRLDLEQGAAVIISAIMNDQSILEDETDTLVRSLFNSLHPSTFITSCMWLEPDNIREPPGTKLHRFMGWTRKILSLYLDYSDRQLSKAQDWSTLVPFLLRVRRCRPFPPSRCLFIPPWIFEAANIDPPAHHLPTLHAYKPGHEPTDPSSSGPLFVLSRHHFSALQRRLNNYHQYWHPNLALRAEIRTLESTTLHNTTHLQHAILPSTSTLEVAHAFLSLQRTLQRKVVSDPQRRFLPKGASGTIMQNTPYKPTRFESVLYTAINPTTTLGINIPTVPQRGIPIHPAALPQLDRTCLLMEQYVSLYGAGSGSNLVFHPGPWGRGGGGRGAVDEYNKLCDILKRVKEQAKQELGHEVEIGPVRKFLAKDIMQWNGAWGDDAFASGFVPGWVGWLEGRREKGVLLSEWEEAREGEKKEREEGGEMEMEGLVMGDAVGGMVYEGGKKELALRFFSQTVL